MTTTVGGGKLDPNAVATAAPLMSDYTEYDSKLDYSNQTKAERFAKLNGIEWNEGKTKKEKCSCGEVTFLSNPTDQNPTFTDAKSILEVMENRLEDPWKFIEWISGKVTSLGWTYWVKNPDKLLDEAVSWCERFVDANKTMKGESK